MIFFYVRGVGVYEPCQWDTLTISHRAYCVSIFFHFPFPSQQILALATSCQQKRPEKNTGRKEVNWVVVSKIIVFVYPYLLGKINILDIFEKMGWQVETTT